MLCMNIKLKRGLIGIFTTGMVLAYSCDDSFLEDSAVADAAADAYRGVFPAVKLRADGVDQRKA